MHEGQYVEIAQTLERPGLLAEEIALPKAVGVDLDELVPGLFSTFGTWLQTFGQHDVTDRLPRDLAACQFADLSENSGQTPPRLHH